MAEPERRVMLVAVEGNQAPYSYDFDNPEGDGDLEFARTINRRGQKITLYAIIKNDVPYFGWAICHRDDPFMFELGISIARHRLYSYQCSRVQYPNEHEVAMVRWPIDFFNLDLGGKRTAKYRRERDEFVRYVLSHIKDQQRLTVTQTLPFPT